MSSPISRSEFAPFDVVVVPFPYSDRLAEKRRPAVVVSTIDLQRTRGLAWLVMITSAPNPRWQHDVDISDLAAAGLPAPSLLRPAKIATVDVPRILRRAGRLCDADQRLLGAQLQSLIAR